MGKRLERGYKYFFLFTRMEEIYQYTKYAKYTYSYIFLIHVYEKGI